MRLKAYLGQGLVVDQQNNAENGACYCISMGQSLDLSQTGRDFAALFGMEGDKTCV